MSEIKQAGQKTSLPEQGSSRPYTEEESLWPLETRLVTWEDYSILLVFVGRKFLQTLAHYMVRMVILQKEK